VAHARKRALVVIDVQNEYFTGDLPIEYPDRNASLANIARAMDAARAAGVAVIVVQQDGPAGGLFANGTRGWHLMEAVASRPRDHFVSKLLPSAFAATDLEAWLRSRDLDTLAVAGFMTHNCVDATIKHAMHADFAVEYLADASGSVPYSNRSGTVSAREIHTAFAVVMQSRFASVMTTADWVAGISGSQMPERDSIRASNQRARALRLVESA